MSVQPNDVPSGLRPPECPACKKPMRLERVSPDIRYFNLDHFLFKCECGWDSDQLVAIRD